MDPIQVSLETGEKKVFAIALDWPGWARSGRDETTALQALLDYGPRYAKALALENIAFHAPDAGYQLQVVEQTAGSKTTDFGAPDAAFSNDDAPVDAEQLAHFSAILRACWHAFADVLDAAAGKPLRTGPRGGGRDLERMAAHVLDAEAAYLARLGVKPQRTEESGLRERLAQIQNASLLALAASARGELPKAGPRGGKIWPARVYVRRSAWHILDHAWEIEDRLIIE